MNENWVEKSPQEILNDVKASVEVGNPAIHIIFLTDTNGIRGDVGGEWLNTSLFPSKQFRWGLTKCEAENLSRLMVVLNKNYLYEDSDGRGNSEECWWSDTHTDGACWFSTKWVAETSIGAEHVLITVNMPQGEYREINRAVAKLEEILSKDLGTLEDFEDPFKYFGTYFWRLNDARNLFRVIDQLIHRQNFEPAHKIDELQREVAELEYQYLLERIPFLVQKGPSWSLDLQNALSDMVDVASNLGYDLNPVRRYFVTEAEKTIALYSKAAGIKKGCPLGPEGLDILFYRYKKYLDEREFPAELDKDFSKIAGWLKAIEEYELLARFEHDYSHVKEHLGVHFSLCAPGIIPAIRRFFSYQFGFLIITEGR